MSDREFGKSKHLRVLNTRAHTMPGNDDLTLPKGTLKVHPHPILPRFFLWDVIAKHDAHMQRLHFEKHVRGTSRPCHGSVYGAAVEGLL